MNTEYDFDNIGKKIPYSVPDGFFDEITNATLEKAKKRERQFIIRKLIFAWSAAASVLVIVSLAIFMSTRTQLTESSALAGAGQVQPEISYDSATSAENRAQSAPAVATTEPETAGFKNTETLDDLFAKMDEEELQQLATLLSGELFIDELLND